MVASKRLTGVVLVDCAKANSAQGLKVAAEQCGYGEDTRAFLEALKTAGDEMGVEIEELKDLQTESDAS